MGRAGEGGGVHRQDEPDAGVLEIHLAEAGDGRGDVAAKDVDGDFVAQVESHLGGFLGGKADQRRAVIVSCPPVSVGDAGVRGHLGGIGHAPVAVKHPVLARDLGRRLAVDPGNDAAQHRSAVYPADGGIVFNAIQKAVDLIRLQVDKEVGRRDLWQFARDGALDVAVDLADAGQHGEAKAKRQHHGRGLSAPRGNRAKGQPQAGTAPCRAGETGGKPAGKGGGQNQ